MISYGETSRKQSDFISSLSRILGKTINAIGGMKGFDAVIKNLTKYYAHTGITDEEKERLATEDAYLDENREAEYALKEKWYMSHESLPAKKAEYEEAGLNPMLMAGQGSVSASNAPTGQMPTSSPSAADPISALMSVVGTLAQVKDLGASADLKRSQSRHQDIVNKWEDRQQESIYNERVATIKNLQANLPKLVADAKHAEILAQYAPQLFNSQVIKNNKDAELAVAKAAEARSQVKLNDAETAEVYQKIQNHKKEIDLMNNEIMKIQQECITLGSQAYLNDQLVQESMSRVAKYEKQIELIGKQIGLIDKEITWYKYNHAHQNAASGSVSALWGLFSVSGSGQGHAYGGPPE